MSRLAIYCGFALLALGLAHVSVWADDLVIAPVEKKGTINLGVVQGRVRPVPSEKGATWDISLPGKQGTSDLRLTSGKWAGWSVAYDPKGKKPTVFLSRKEAVWKITRVTYGTFTIQAARGKYNGWYLDFDYVRQAGGLAAVVVKKPERIPKYEIFPLSR